MDANNEEPVKIVVAGTRHFNDANLMRLELHKFVRELKTTNIEVVSGGAKGADTLGEKYAKHYKQKLKVFPADWEKYGRGAGHRRNAEMAKYADACIVFWDGKSKGTQSMIELAKKRSLTLKVVIYEEE